MIGVQVPNKDFVQIVVGIFIAEIRSAEPEPMSKRNLSPFPSSTNQQAAACFGRALGIPVPHAITRISSGARSSEPG